MKSRLVLWGKNEEEDSIILAYELEPVDKVLTLYVFDFITSNETFFQDLLNKWRKREEVPFPENVEVHTFPLTMSEPVLPATVKVDSADVLEEARMDWHFVVLSNELFVNFSSELEDLEERINKSTNYDQKEWDDLKAFSDRVLAKIKEEVLAWKHSRKIKVRSTKLFNLLKERRSSFNEANYAEFNELKTSINKQLEGVEKAILGGDKKEIAAQASVLKNIQTSLKKETKFPEKIRKGILKRVNFNYNKVNQSQFGEGKEGYLGHLNKRKESIDAAIKRAEKKKSWLEREINFQDKKSNNPRTLMQQQFSGAQKEMYKSQLVSVDAKLVDLKKVLSGIDRKIKRQEKDSKKTELTTKDKSE